MCVCRAHILLVADLGYDSLKQRSWIRKFLFQKVKWKTSFNIETQINKFKSDIKGKNYYRMRWKPYCFINQYSVNLVKEDEKNYLQVISSRSLSCLSRSKVNVPSFGILIFKLPCGSAIASERLCPMRNFPKSGLATLTFLVANDHH